MATEQAISKVDMDRIEGSYTIPDPDAVRGLLARYPHVVPALLEAPARLKEAFGSRLRGLVLEALHDPEEGERLLSASALVKGSPREAFELMEQFDEQWWGSEPPAVHVALVMMAVPV